MSLNFEELGLPPAVRLMEINYLVAAKAIIARVHHSETKCDWLYWRAVDEEPRYRVLLPQEPMRTILSYVPDPSGSRLYVLKCSCTPTLDGMGMGMDFEALYEVEVGRDATPKELMTRPAMGGNWIAALLGAGDNPAALYCSVARYESRTPTGESVAYKLERLDLATRMFSHICDLPGVFI
ncbi:MAG: hypothetical protein E6J65_21140 [Deltaproteobacteria bacterium]|nr:MAG: hypothetical protein E6J65_21140 [Deltaproteobacteria bacterium]